MLKDYAKPGTDLYYIVRRLDAKTKAAYVGISALYQTWQTIPETYKEANIAEQKLLWWQTEMERFFAGEASHPILKTLQSVKALLSETECLALLEANRLSLKTHIFDTRAELLKHYQHLGGVQFNLLQSVLGDKFKALSPAICHELGVVNEVLRHLIFFRHFLGRQHLYFSLEDFQAKNIDPMPILRLQNLDSLNPLFDFYYDFAKKKFNAMQLNVSNPLRLTVLLKLKQAKLLRGQAWQVFSHQLELSPIRKLFITTFL